MRRFMLLFAAAAFFLTASAGPAAAYASSASSCVAAADATYRHTFDGEAGTVTITAVHPLCEGESQAFSLVSYTDTESSGQFLYDTAHASISAGRRSRTLKVGVPACDNRVYAAIGTAMIDESTSDTDPYGTAGLGSDTGSGSRSTGTLADYSGGDTACAAAPEVTFTNACDGTITAALSNDADANAKAVFVTGGRMIRVAPGHSKTLAASNGGTLTIRASSFTTYVGTWRAPVTGCTDAAAPARTAPAATTRPAAPGAASPVPAASTSPSMTAEAPAAGFSVNPTLLATARRTTDLAQAGMSTGSILAIALGMLMVGGGTIVLTRVIRTARRPA